MSVFDTAVSDTLLLNQYEMGNTIIVEAGLDSLDGLDDVIEIIEQAFRKQDV